MVGVRLNTAAPHPGPLPGGARGQSELFESEWLVCRSGGRNSSAGSVLGVFCPAPARSALGIRLNSAAPHPGPLPGGARGQSELFESEWLVCRSGGRNSSAGSVLGVFCPAPARSALGIRLNIVAPHPSPLPGGARGGPSCLTGMWLGCRSDGRRTSPCSVRMTGADLAPSPLWGEGWGEGAVVGTPHDASTPHGTKAHLTETG